MIPALVEQELQVLSIAPSLLRSFPSKNAGICAPPPGQYLQRMKGQTMMSEAKLFNNFRIWAAVGTAVLYVFLAATGNA